MRTGQNSEPSAPLAPCKDSGCRRVFGAFPKERFTMLPYLPRCGCAWP